jgi:N-ethylmaleimide reductase
VADLFEPVRLGDLALSNRIVMAPMTRSRAGPHDEPTADVIEYYRQRATAGLIVSEGVHPSRHGKGYWRTPGIHTPPQIEGWRRVADAVHGEGGRIVLQIMHCGRASVRENKDADADTVAPSAVPCRAEIWAPSGMSPCEPPRALETGEIAGVIDEFRRAALNARAAGCEGVELHCTSGYLPMQFLSTNTNLRSDRYGGSTVNRIRFVVEVLEAMADAIGAGRVGFRINPGSPYNDMQDADPVDTYGTLLRALDSLGLAYVHLIHRPTPELDALDLVNRHWSGPVIGNDELTPASARALLASGRVQAVSFGRAFISNPDLVARFRLAAPLAEPLRHSFYTGDAGGYIDYPRWTP